MQQYENIIEPLWQVILEVTKDQMYCYKGQKLDEIVMAIDKDVAVDKVIKMHQIDIENITIKGIRSWSEENDKTLQNTNLVTE